MSIYKVERRVDTVIIEMDIAVAEKLQEVLFIVQDNARTAYGSDLVELRVRLEEDAEVRFPSPLFKAEPREGYVLVSNRSREEYEYAYENINGTLNECEECGGTTNRHFLPCPIFGNGPLKRSSRR